MIWKECEVCGKEAILKEVGPDERTGRFFEIFVCPEGHETRHRPRRRKAKPDDELENVRRLNRLLDNLGVD